MSLVDCESSIGSFWINDSCRAKVKLFRSIERNFSDTYDRNHGMSHYQSELNLWGHTSKRKDLDWLELSL